MDEWLLKLDQLDIPDGAVPGLSNTDRPTLEGKLLQISDADRLLFFRGQHTDILKRLRTLLPENPSGEIFRNASCRQFSSLVCGLRVAVDLRTITVHLATL